MIIDEFKPAGSGYGNGKCYGFGKRYVCDGNGYGHHNNHGDGCGYGDVDGNGHGNGYGNGDDDGYGGGYGTVSNNPRKRREK